AGFDLAALPGVRFDERTSAFRAQGRYYRPIVETLIRTKQPYQDDARGWANEPAGFRLEATRDPFPHQREALAAWTTAGRRGDVRRGGGRQPCPVPPRPHGDARTTRRGRRPLARVDRPDRLSEGDPSTLRRLPGRVPHRAGLRGTRARGSGTVPRVPRRLPAVRRRPGDQPRRAERLAAVRVRSPPAPG